MSDITKIKVDGEPESSYQLYPRNEEFAKRAGGNGGSQSGVQPNWNQNDKTAPDYIKNRPFYTDAVETVLVEESTVSFSFVASHGVYSATFPSTFEATIGETYKVSWDGTVYECTCVLIEGLPLIGNPSIRDSGSDTGEPFLMGVNNGNRINILTTDTSASHTFSISRFVEEVVKIDRKYLSKAAFITYNPKNNTYSSDLTNDELYEIMLNGWPVVTYSPTYNSCVYLTKWTKKANGTIDLSFDGGSIKLSLYPDGTIGVTKTNP